MVDIERRSHLHMQETCSCRNLWICQRNHGTLIDFLKASHLRQTCLPQIYICYLSFTSVCLPQIYICYLSFTSVLSQWQTIDSATGYLSTNMNLSSKIKNSSPNEKSPSTCNQGASTPSSCNLMKLTFNGECTNIHPRVNLSFN